MQLKLTNKVLYRKTKPATFEDPVANKRLADAMIELMIRHNGIGLTANQVGISKSIIVMQIEGKVYQLFNPEWWIPLLTSKRELAREGCLSFPGESYQIWRSSEINLSAADPAGNHGSIVLTGLAARCFQHEADHMAGITFHEKTESWKALTNKGVTA